MSLSSPVIPSTTCRALVALGALAALDRAWSAEDAPAAPPAPAAASEQIVVTAQRQESLLDRTDASVDVIDQGDLRDRGYQPFVHDWLRGLPGVDVLQTGGGFAGSTDLRLRGSGAAETKILQDGIPVTDPAGISGTPLIEMLNPTGIQRVEVVRGAQSGLYGSGAIGGVVNLISAQPTAAPVERLRIEGGSFGTALGDLEATGPLTSWLGYAFGATALRSSGFSAESDPGAGGDARGHERDGVHRLDVNARLVADDAPAKRSAYVALSASSSEQDLDFNGPDDSTNYQTQHNWRASAGGHAQLAPGFDLAADAAYSVNNRAYPEEAVFDKSFDASETYTSLRAKYAAPHGVTVTAGCDGSWQRADIVAADGTTNFDRGARLVGVWGEAVYELKPIEVSATARHDEHSRDGSADTYRLGTAGFFFDQRLKLFASTGTGFRAPSLYELYAGFTGNPDLTPQTSTSYEAGQTTSIRELSLRLTDTFFRTTYHHQITFDPNTFASINLPSSSHIEGVENSLRYDGAPCGFGLTYTWQRSDDGTGQRLALLPTHKLAADTIWHLASTWLRLAVERQWSRRVGAADLPPFTLLSAAAGWDVTEHWQVYVRGDNLGDEHYEIYPGFSTPRRSGYAGVEATF